MSDHSITSPSSFFRRVLCPGSEAAELGAPEDAETTQAAAGTLLHHYDANPDEEVEQVSHAEIVERNKKLRDEYLERKMLELGIRESDKRKEYSELELILRGDNGEFVIGPDGKPFKGTADKVIWFPDHRILFIFDSKFGRKKVPPAESNYQLRTYAVMAGDPDYGDFDPRRVFAGITQPLASPQFHAVEYDRGTLSEAKRECLAILRAAREPDAPRNASVDACFYCKAKASCPAVLAVVKQAAAEKISELPIPQLEALAPVIEMVEVAAKAWRARIKYIATNYPHLLERLEIGRETESRFIAPEKSFEAYEKLASVGLLFQQEFTQCCKPSITKITEAVAKKENISIDEAKSLLERTLGDTIQKRPRSGSIQEKKPQPLIEV